MIEIKQGTVLPTTGIGVGYMFILIYLILVWNYGLQYVMETPSTYLLLVAFSLMQFSYKDFLLNPSKPDHYTYRYRIMWLFEKEVHHKFSEYDYFVLKVVNRSFYVKQGVSAGLSVGSGKHSESYLAIIGKRKTDKENIEICKAKKIQLDGIITSYIQPTGIKTYLGAPKKGYEYTL